MLLMTLHRGILFFIHMALDYFNNKICDEKKVNNMLKFSERQSLSQTLKP